MGSIETKLKKLEDDSPFERFELEDGSYYWYKPDELWRAFFGYYFSAMKTDFEGAPREEVPDVFKAIARAKDREAAMTQVATTWREWRTDFDLKACIDLDKLVETGEIIPFNWVRYIYENDPSVTEEDREEYEQLLAAKAAERGDDG